MTVALVALVERAGVAAVQTMHPSREVLLPALEDEVVVIRHQAPGVECPLRVAGDPVEEIKEEVPVGDVAVDVYAGVAARPDVVVAGALDARWARHAPKVSAGRAGARTRP
jgi:hypothetical protein